MRFYLKVISILISACLLIQIPIRGKDTNSDQKGRLPTVFLIGAAKAGTSSLFELMIQHPQLCSGEKKESHFFNDDDVNVEYHKGIDHYKHWFRDRKCDDISTTHFIDGTPIVHLKFVWERINSTYTGNEAVRDNLKFIVLLREPLSREISWYKHSMSIDAYAGQSFSEIKTFNETKVSNYYDIKKSYAHSYKDQLEAFCKVFRRDQLLVLSSDKLIQNTTEIMERIRKFIDIKTDKSFQKSLPHDDHLDSNPKSTKDTIDCIMRHVPALDCDVRDRAGAFYEVPNSDLYTWLESTAWTPTRRGKASSLVMANINEPKFWPFNTYKSLTCVNNSRSDFNKLLRADKRSYPPLLKCVQ
jgi:hypothetical protein